MTIRGAKAIDRTRRLIRSRFVDGALILLYHRITRETLDPYSLNVTPERFADHLAVIQQRNRVTRLQDLVNQLDEDRVVRGGIILTFDDGYADNLHEAKPALERFEVPATIFVTSGFVGHDESWWDRLSRLLLGGPAPAAGLSLTVAGKTHKIQARSGVELLHEIHRVIRPLDEAIRENALQQIAERVRGSARATPSYPLLTADELLRLSAGELIEVGAHTVTHPVLSTLSEAQESREVTESRASLEHLLGRPVTSVSFPYGQRADYTARTIGIVRDAGFRCACTAIPDVVWRRSDRLELPRLWVNDWPKEEFSRRLSGWLGA